MRKYIDHLDADEQNHAHHVAKMIRDAMMTVVQDVGEIVDVCQWDERGAETMYIMGPGGVMVRVMVEPLDMKDPVDFLNGEPGVEIMRVDSPLDVIGALLSQATFGSPR